MNKSEKEMAFLHGIYVEDIWTAKFTDIFDEKFKSEGLDTLLYLNAGSGNHALSLSKKIKDNTQIFAVCENQELQKIAHDKATSVRSDLGFSTSIPLAESDFVLADSSLVKSEDIKAFLTQAVSLSSGGVAFFLPTSGSFGEMFSYLWEVFLDLDLLEKGSEIEKLISDLPTVEGIKDIARSLNLKKINATTKTEFLEFENGKEFVESPLVGHFLMPSWLGFLDEKEKEQVLDKLAQKIDDERDELSFRCSIKATLVTAQKA